MTSKRKSIPTSSTSSSNNNQSSQKNHHQQQQYGAMSITQKNSSDDDDVFDDETMESNNDNVSIGSNWVGAAFNLTSSVVGAGCIGLGGAVANSGGLISIIAILTFAVLSKYSFDLVVNLGLLCVSQNDNNNNNNRRQQQQQVESSYESLGYITYGKIGKLIVIISKSLYSFGCTVAYIKIIQDNFSLAASQLLYGNDDDNNSNSNSNNNDSSSFIRSIIENKDLSTIILCTTIMFPLCLLRDLTPLEKVSALKIVAVLSIVLIVMYLFFALDNNSSEGPSSGGGGGGFVENWLSIKDGVWESLGTFVFTFVGQHTIHLVFQSLKPSQRSMSYFGKTTTLAVMMATAISLLLGLFAYMTFWEETSSDIFQLYPPGLGAIEFCRLLLCASMLLTYPFPFLTVRELLILLLFANKNTSSTTATAATNIQQQQVEEKDDTDTHPLLIAPLELKEYENQQSSSSSTTSSLLIPGSETQLKRPYHVAMTTILWLITLVLALKASSLGAVLNLTGCALGTVISYILPSLFSYKLRGHTFLGSLLLLLGGSVGLIGTYYSIIAFF